MESVGLITLPEQPPTESNPASCYLAGLQSKASRRAMKTHLDTIAALALHGRSVLSEITERRYGSRNPYRDLCFDFPWHQLRREHTVAIKAHLAEHFSPAGANVRLSALKGVLRECWRLNLIPAEDYNRAVDLKGVKGTRLLKGRALSQGEIRALFLVCGADKGPIGRRDAAILAVLYGTGLRRSEAVTLDVSDVDPETGTLTVRGKGNKDRECPLPAGTRIALDTWIQIRGDADGSLFTVVRKGGHVESGRLTSHSIHDILRKRAQEAGITDCSPHDLRRSFISDLLDAGADVLMVQELAGHAQPTTTKKYDRRPAAARRKAVELLHVPVAG